MEENSVNSSNSNQAQVLFLAIPHSWAHGQVYIGPKLKLILEIES
jgi:hypothetical protein